MKLKKEKIEKIISLRSEWKKLREIASIINCNIATVHRHCWPYEPIGRKEIQRRYYQKRKLKQAVLSDLKKQWK